MPEPHLSIFVACRLPNEVKADLRRDCDVVFADELPSDKPTPTLLSSCDRPILLVSVNEPLDSVTIARLPTIVRAIATYSVGHEHIDLDAARKRGIAVFHTPAVLSESVAEVAMLLLLGAARRATESIDLIRSGAWSGWTATQLNGIELAGKQLGILGMGRIGRAIARRASAFEMTIHYCNRRRLAPDAEQDALYHADPREMFALIDALILAAPSTSETIGFLDERRLSWLKQGALVVNIARGNLVVDDDLIAALKRGKIFAAGLDVFNGEPQLDPRYFELRNVFMLPHIGSSTIETRRRMAAVLVQGLRSWLTGEEPANRLA
jgi:lactate dehydrogenase-like 2-hydroxyacid dehydrogenase